MKKHMLASNLLIYLGLIAMIIGALDPFHGFILILPGSGLVALGAFVGQSQHRKLLYLAFAFVLLGIGIMAGVGILTDSHGRSEWWTLSYLPYPAGWVIGLMGTIGKSRYRKLLFVAFILILGGIGSMSALDKDSIFFMLGICHPLGLILCLIVTVMMLIKSFSEQTGENDDLKQSP